MKLLSQIKNDMEFNRNLAGLIDVLKEIAIFQYHVLEKRVKSYDEIFVIFESLFNLVSVGGVQPPLLDFSRRLPGVIAITSDIGLLGALNMQVMSLALREVEVNHAQLIIIGEKGKLYAQESNIPFVAFEGIKDEKRFTQAKQLRDYIINEELNQRLGALKVIYPYAVSLMAQRIQNIQVLPLTQPAGAQSSVYRGEVIMESSAADIVGYLIYLFLGQKFYEIFGLSRLAEMAARFVHLEDSGHKLEDMEKQIQLQYFRQRHELIDRNMRELFASRLAFKN